MFITKSGGAKLEKIVLNRGIGAVYGSFGALLSRDYPGYNYTFCLPSFGSSCRSCPAARKA